MECENFFFTAEFDGFRGSSEIKSNKKLSGNDIVKNLIDSMKNASYELSDKYYHKVIWLKLKRKVAEVIKSSIEKLENGAKPKKSVEDPLTVIEREFAHIDETLDKIIENTKPANAFNKEGK